VTLLLLSLFAAGSIQSAAIFSVGGWTPIQLNGGVYSDAAGDSNPSATDLMGGSDGSGTFSAGDWHNSLDDDPLLLRMRLESDGSGSNSV
jgi:hypothetical protein